MPLTDPDVWRWRISGLGANPPHVPTLLRVRGSDIRAWTGTAMGTRLLRRLGVRDTRRLLLAFGELRQRSAAEPARVAANTFGRKQFMKLGAGLGVAAALVLRGKVPAAASTEPATDPAQWVAANKDRLPKSYAELVEYSMGYRKAIFSTVSPSAKGKFWVDHLEHYRATHPDLSSAQSALLEDMSAFVRTAFLADPSKADIARLKEAAIREFGKDGARGLIATLGPPVGTRDHVDCDCNVSDSYCDEECIDMFNCGPSECWCTYSSSGCGTFWFLACNGICDFCRSCH